MGAISSEEFQDALKKVEAMAVLPEAPEPRLPSFGPKVPIKTKLKAIQNFIISFEYNYTGALYFDINKNRSFKSIVNTAKEIIRESLPIQCLEAVFLGSYLTAEFSNLERFPVSFQTLAGTSIHRHIVLCVHHQQKWGALGLSRCDKLMNKEMTFDSLSDLVLDYCNEYVNVYHEVVKVNVGFPITHNIHSSERVEWRVLNLLVDLNNWVEIASQLDSFGKDAAEIERFKKANGEFPAWFRTKFALCTQEVEVHSPRVTQRFSIFFDDGCEFQEEVQEPVPAQQLSSARKLIIVTPDEFHFEKPYSRLSVVQPSPTNIFLQNVSVSPFLVEIEDKSGLLQIVTQTQSALSKEHIVHQEATALPSNFLRATFSFRISAKGMVVVAIKYNPGANSYFSSALPSKSSHIKEDMNGTGIAEFSSVSRRVVSFRCTPITNASENQVDAVPSGKSFMLETPFVFKEV